MVNFVCAPGRAFENLSSALMRRMRQTVAEKSIKQKAVKTNKLESNFILNDRLCHCLLLFHPCFVRRSATHCTTASEKAQSKRI
jgi:hypothetical protein